MADHSGEDCSDICIHHNPALLPPLHARHLSALPDEMLAKILSFVPTKSIFLSVHRVDRRLKRLGFDSVTDIDLRRLGDDTPQLLSHQPRLRRHVGHCRRLKRLRLLPRREPSSISLALVALRNCPKLERLEGVHGATHVLSAAMEEHGNALRSLELENSDLAKPVRLPRGLTSIELISCRGIDDRILREIAERCANLESFVTRGGTVRYTPYGMDSFLQTLRGSIKRISIECVSLTHAIYRDLGQCQMLEALYLHGMKMLRSEGLGFILRSLPKLRELKIVSCHGIDEGPVTGHDVAAAFSSSSSPGRLLEGLESLHLRGLDGLNNRELCLIAQRCPNLHTFALKTISTSGTMTEAGIRGFVGRCGRLRRLLLNEHYARRVGELKRKGQLPDWLEIETLKPSTTIPRGHVVGDDFDIVPVAF